MNARNKHKVFGFGPDVTLPDRDQVEALRPRQHPLSLGDGRKT